MFRWMRLLAASLALTIAPRALAAESWTTATEERPVEAGSAVTETIWTSTRGSGPYDQIGLHRYRAAGESVAAVLYLPGTNMNGAAALTEEKYNLWLYLAARGIEVYALDYRTHAVPAAATAENLAQLKDWTSAAFIDDIAAASSFARETSGRDKLFVAGFSRGAFLAYAFANVDPQHIAGLVILDGPFKALSPGVFDRAPTLAELEASGRWASDVGGSKGWDVRQQLMEAVIANPDGPAADPQFETIGDQLAHVLQTAWLPGGLANPEGGVSKPVVLAKLLKDYDRWYPSVQDVDGKAIAASADAPDTNLDDLWGKFETPILLFASTGMGGDWVINAIHSAVHSGSKDVTLNVLERYGHLDVLVGENAAAEVFEPTAAWIRARAP